MVDPNTAEELLKTLEYLMSYGAQPSYSDPGKVITGDCGCCSSSETPPDDIRDVLAWVHKRVKG